ncbi:hypothetical protein AWW66_29870 [Micromonospora rosaria]|uniref:Uncharacterized protein n=2 Tax=Micromonospora rosaria TaxID=47874 RepID=A0A136PJ35_9ACTN|nr:hypothetical protein [Micromonospora rosaria]KXK58425.1 hypothetical protein AWW66_29870 [Micromonospora rosaria]
MTVWRYALRVGVVLACLSGVEAVLADPAHAAFSTELSGLPDRFTAGGRVETVTAVVSRIDRAGGCGKVRWSLLVQVQGLRLDQVRVDRVEETGSFPVQVRAEGSVARLTDRQLDPGTLCPDRTVTARYRVAFAGDVTDGRVTLAAEAYDVDSRLLARQTATRSVVGAGVRPTPTTAAPPETEPTVEPTEPAEPTVEATVPTEEPIESTDEAVTDVPAAGAGRPAAQTGGFGLVHAAFLLGGLLLFLGVSLLLRLRHLLRPADAAEEPTEPSPERRWERPASAQRWRPARR